MKDQVYAFSLIFTVMLLSIFKGTSGLTMYQSPSVTGSEGDTVILNCTLSNETLGSVRWYKGENQQQLLYSQFTTDKTDSRVSRTVKEGPTVQTDQSITFTSITWGDAGMYYCVKFKSDKVTVAASGNGTRLYVTRKPSPPSISGPNQQVRLNSSVTLSCLSAGFYPKEISITWWQNEMAFLNETITVSSHDEDMTYKVQGNITVEAKINSSFTCRINHTTLQQPMNSTFQITNIVNDPSSPSISGPRERVLLNTNMALICTSEGFYPKDVSVTWWQNGAEIKESKPNVSLYEANQTYKVQSNITVPGKIDSNVTCRINHRALQQESIFNMNDLLKGIPSHPSIAGPTEQVVLNTNVTLNCTSEGFYPQDINVTWLQHGRELQGSTSDIHLYGQEKTYQVLSHITVPASIDSPVTCRINHIALDRPVNSTFEINRIVKGAPSHPSVSGPREKVMLYTDVTLTCTASGFYPSNISVTWWKNETELPNPKTDVNLYGEDKTYRVQSNITLLAEIDSSITCKINHTALDMPIHSAFNINDIVKGIPSVPLISGPTEKIMLNENVTLSCTTEGFYPKEINITWLQNGMEVLNSTKIVYLNTTDKTYHVQSNITVPAKIDSPVICRISHTALELPINSTFQINNIVNEPSTPLISWSKKPVKPNENVMLSCKSEGFYPKNISITWWQNETELNGPKIDVSSYGEDKTYKVESSITVPAKFDLFFTCRIHHAALDRPINSTFIINYIIEAHPSPPVITYSNKINGKVVLTCTSSGFYPKNISLMWTINGTDMNVLPEPNISKADDGTYNISSTINAMINDGIHAVCKIQHLDNETITSNISVTTSTPQNTSVIPVAVGAGCGFIAVFLVSTVAFLHHHKRKKGKNNTTNGSITANREAENKQDENNDSITYATLQLREGPSMPKKVVQEEATEYAEVHFKRVPDNDVTYADVSIAKLRTKEAISHYYIEEHGTEYATVKKKTKPSN